VDKNETNMNKRKEASMARKADKNGRGKVPQEFCITAPDASDVQLVGDFTRWQERPIPLRRESEGVWRAKVELPPGEHRYRFLVDGQWCDDPECRAQAPNPFGSQDAVREVR
jgi:1,4-alpha-glucan branching enzyme